MTTLSILLPLEIQQQIVKICVLHTLNDYDLSSKKRALGESSPPLPPCLTFTVRVPKCRNAAYDFIP